MKKTLVTEADELVTLVVNPAFKAISDIIKIDGAETLPVKAKLSDASTLLSVLNRKIEVYKTSLDGKYTSDVKPHEVAAQLKPSRIEIRTIIASGLSELMQIRATIPPVMNITPIIDIQIDLNNAITAFIPFEERWGFAGWATSRVFTLDKTYLKYCKDLESYVRTTAVSKKVDRAMMKVNRLADASQLLSNDPALKKKLLELANKTRADFLKEIESLSINLCQFSTTDEEIHSEKAMDKFFVDEYRAHYENKVAVVFKRFSQNLNIVSFIPNC